MVNLRQFIITGLIVGIFIFAIINFGVQLSSENNANTTILENQKINSSFTSMNTTLSNTQDTLNSSETSFFSDTIIGDAGIIIESIVGVANVATGIITAVYSLTFGMVASTLGVSSLVVSIFSAIVLITIILLSWRTIKSGG